MKDRITKSETEWRTQLTPEEYYVTREKGTEQAFTGQYHNANDPGIYSCICCGQNLFDSNNPRNNANWTNHLRHTITTANITTYIA